MKDINQKKIIIVGAGIAGLTLAYKLSKQNFSVTVIEKDTRVGGLAKSYRYNDFIFDIGPHRFYSINSEVNRFVKEILDGDYLEIERRSAVWMYNKYYDWPLTIKSIFRMPIAVLLSVLADFLKRDKTPEKNFEDYILSRYGKTLYSIFFKPYTIKFLKTDCSEISKDWAIAGIDRAVIDNKVQKDDLFSMSKYLLKSGSDIKFIYPKSGGIGVFTEKLKEKILENGGEILTNSRIEKIIIKDNKISEIELNGKNFPCDFLVWTGSMTNLLHLLGHPGLGLNYLSLILYNYSVDSLPLVDRQWTYFGSRDIPFNRVSIPCLFNPILSPPGKTGICLEVTCLKDGDWWKNPRKNEQFIRKILTDVNIVKNINDIKDVNIEKIPDAYPVYSIDYKDKLERAKSVIGRYSNIRLLGRTGSFWYNNMDHSIEAAMECFMKFANKSF